MRVRGWQRDVLRVAKRVKGWVPGTTTLRLCISAGPEEGLLTPGCCQRVQVIKVGDVVEVVVVFVASLPTLGVFKNVSVACKIVMF